VLERIKAPWTPQQVEALNHFQQSGMFHPFTCGQRDQWHHEERWGRHLGTLVATEDGWTCPDCSYTQDWAHAFMADPEVLEIARLR
jgi:hypothetical protein